MPALALRGWTRPEAELLAVIDPEAGAYWLGGCFDPALVPSDAGDLGAWVSSDGVIWLLGEGQEGLTLLAITPGGESDRDRRADRLNVGGGRP